MTRIALTVACGFGVAAAAATAQECLEEFHTEDFDAYTAGLPLIPQQPCYPDCPPGFSWQPWYNSPSGGEAEVSNRFARSAPNALRIVGGDPDDFDDGVQHEVPLIRDEWVTFRVVMELNRNTQHIIYGDALVITKDWCEFCHSRELEALDLYGYDASPVYYDNIRLCAVPPLCPEDVDFDWEIGFADLLAVLAAWSPDEECIPRRREDIDGDCKVGFSDLLRVLAAWGPCK